MSKRDNLKTNNKKILADIGERRFLDIISELVEDSELPFNDDACAISINKGNVLVINVDMLVKKTDVLPGTSPQQIGNKAVTMAVSDIIAKGAKPTYCMVSVAIPKDTEIKFAEELFFGIKEQCDLYNCHFIGGDLNEGSDLIVDIIAIGTCKKDQLLPRRGIVNGDYLYVTDLFGLTALGFKILLNSFELSTTFNSYKKVILDSVYNPKAKVEYLPLLQSGLVKATMDSSDGLLRSIKDLMKLNNIGFVMEKVPIHPIVKDIAEKNNLNPLELALSGGEEFALLIIVSKSRINQFERLAHRLELKVFRVGHFTLNNDDIKIADQEFKAYNHHLKGYNHFL